MPDALNRFENIARTVGRLAYADEPGATSEHPFETRNLNPALPSIVKKLFDDGHYAQATFEAFKFVDKEVARLAGSSDSGFKLMMTVFPESSPTIRVNACSTMSEKDEQKGFQFLFAGSMLAIRNPRGHEYSVKDSPDECLDHLGLASLLIRRLQVAGYAIPAV